MTAIMMVPRTLWVGLGSFVRNQTDRHKDRMNSANILNGRMFYK